jgi:hypothetical protein
LTKSTKICNCGAKAPGSNESNDEYLNTSILSEIGAELSDNKD